MTIFRRSGDNEDDSRKSGSKRVLIDGFMIIDKFHPVRISLIANGTMAPS